MSYQRQTSQTIRPTRHPGTVWIEKNRSALPNNHWVAASEQGLEAQAISIGDLMDTLRRNNILPASVAIAFITTDAV